MLQFKSTLNTIKNQIGIVKNQYTYTGYLTLNLSFKINSF